MIPDSYSSETLSLFTGIVASPGIAIGPLHIYRPVLMNIRKQQLPSQAVESELARLELAVDVAKNQLIKVRANIAKNAGERQAMVIDAQLMFLEDPSLIAEVTNAIRTTRLNAEYIISEQINKYAKHFEAIPDEYMRSAAKISAISATGYCRIYWGSPTSLFTSWSNRSSSWSPRWPHPKPASFPRTRSWDWRSKKGG